MARRIVAIAILLSLAIPAAAVAAPPDPLDGLSDVQRAAIKRGPLPKDPAIRAAATTGKPPAPAPGGGRPGPGGPTVVAEFDGLVDDQLTPPDATGAIGPTRYVELVNDLFGIYDRSGTLLDGGQLAELAGRPLGEFVFDPQVIWDPGTQRFYYVMVDIVGSNDNRLAFGWSTTASPTTSADWCAYSHGFGYGSSLPDYPKLGDTEDFLLVGVNVFAGGVFFARSDVVWVQKPPPGPACPAPASLNGGKQVDLRDFDGSATFTPVPMNQVDDDQEGWVVATDPYETPRTFASLFRVTTDPATGDAVIQGMGTRLGIPAYELPPPAPQRGTSITLDTLDARFTQGMSSVHPLLGRQVLWTQHTVEGGAGSMVRWFAIDPAVPRRLTRTITHPSLFAFNAAISTDRANDGSAAAFGANAVVGFSTSSSSTFSAIQMVSQVGAGPQSGFVLVKQSPGFNRDDSCLPTCRWGDYSGASPDPAAPHAAGSGIVWLANQWNDASADSVDNDWRTWIWAAAP